MNVSLQQTQKLLLDESLNFDSLGLSMLVTRLKVFHERDPVKHTLEDCTNAINAFLERFGDIIAHDFEKISKL